MIRVCSFVNSVVSFFFFKHKTAYEMRISDWSSDVCSSDLSAVGQKTGTSMLGSRLAWYITIFMGLQSLLFYCSVAWLPVVLQDWGMASEQSDWVLYSVQLTQLPIAFVAPLLAGHIKHQNPFVWFSVTPWPFCSLTISIV